MRNFVILFMIVIITGSTSSCKKDSDLVLELSETLKEELESSSPSGEVSYFEMPHEADLERIPQDPKNKLTTEKVRLGGLLYHETGLALAPVHSVGKGTYSCGSCHFASAGFQAGRPQGIGDGGIGVGVNGEGRAPQLSIYTGAELDVQPIRSPTAMNGAWQEAMLWNGQFGSTGINASTIYAWQAGTPIEVNHLGYHGLETQAIAGLEVHRMVVNRTILDTLGYKELFDVVFWDIPENDRYNNITAGLAIAAYERTLLSNQAPFQKWLKGDISVISAQELRGAILFFDVNKGNCVSCHTGPALNSMAFYALGTNDLYEIEEQVFRTSEFDPVIFGRGGFTGKSEDMYKFKVPQLYNLTDSPYYFHGSSLRSLEGVLKYKNEAIPQKLAIPQNQLAEAFIPLKLSVDEIQDLKVFLETALYDPNLSRYVPPILPSGNCFPFNDEIARIHLDCN